MLQQFLENKVYSFTIAQIAIVFQSVLTALISICLVGSLVDGIPPLQTLRWLLIVDIIFVALHLSYRSVYQGPREKLPSSQKTTLLVHVISSLSALVVTAIFVQKELLVEVSSVLALLVVWLVSLASGLIFFKKKYIVER